MQKEFVKIDLKELIPYDNNSRINDMAVHDVIQSMNDCGNIDPIEIDENNVILSGHTRLLALQELGETETEVIRVTGLTDKQKRKYRILANKTNEIAEWDFTKLELELEDLDFSDYDLDFDIPEFDYAVSEKTESDFSETEEEFTVCPNCGLRFVPEVDNG